MYLINNETVDKNAARVLLRQGRGSAVVVGPGPDGRGAAGCTADVVLERGLAVDLQVVALEPGL